ncbi:protein RNA-directed DNA methylation 3 isoform X2 [Cucumis melo]|uniref:Protein RNA-directed DNA methylation 3 isoform X2 n=1 Tax=Cucumis melo TaxID=3656 RepID=A0ABM3KL18_CUCME|nr:protein RNA-directed DNA methylation 3 isoform X2 [Cucumis melo]
MASKGKGIAKDSPSGKRKLRDDNTSSAARKRRDRNVLQFFEDVAPEVGGESDDSDFFDDLMDMEENLGTLPTFKNDDAKAQDIPFFPKEEEMNEEEFDRMMEEVYNRAPGLGAFADENYENKNSTGRNPPAQSAKETISLWKVKCMVGRERQSVFCLMQKFVDLHSFGNKLQIKSAFCVEHVKGFIYVEAPRQYDLIEACKGITGIYSTRVASVPENDISQLLTVRSRVSEVTVGTMARVKNGKYKGDLAQIIAVNNARKRATVKLVPRIDLQAMAEKFGGGAAAKKTVNPAPRLINPSELAEFRPLMQFRRDRETGKLFEFLDGMMLKDGYLYKKISLDSLNCWGVMPSEDELLKFKPSESNESNDLEWLSQLYGEKKKKKKVVTTEKGGGKGEGSSGSSSMSSFGDHDLVCFGRKDFGMILGTSEKDDSYKILKDGPDGSVVVNVQRKELKSGALDAKFTAADHNGKIISVSDNVKVLEGSLKDKQGIVKHVYRHTLFVYDENEVDNDGYFCCKSNMCEKIKMSYDAPGGKEDDKGFSGFEDFSSSPKSPLSPKKSWAEKETGREYNRDDRADGMFSIGQTLRIRVGPLKGYLCRVIAVRKRDVTVKLDSQQKVLTVRSDFLSEVQRKSSAAAPLSEDPLKPFDILGNEGGSQDWIGGGGSSAGGDGWNSAAPSSESPWPSFPESGTSNGPGSSSTNPFGSDAINDEDSPWISKSTPEASTSWGAAKSSVDTANDGQASGWGKGDSKTCSDGNASGAWGKTVAPSGHSAGFTDSESGGWKKNQSANFGDDKTPAETAADRWGSKSRSSGSWGDQNASTTVSEVQPAGKGNAGAWNEGTAQDESGGWGKPKNFGDVGSSAWNKSTAGDRDGENDSWNKPKPSSHDGSVGKKEWGQGNEASDNGNKWQSSRSDGGKKWGSNEAEPEGGSSWNTSKSSDVVSASWKDKPDSSSLTAPKGDQWAGGWDKQHSSNNTKASDDNSPWNKKSVESGKDGEIKNQGSGWNVGKTSGGDSASGWGQTSKEAGLSDQAGSWGSNWKKNSGAGNEDSSSAKKSSWGSGGGNSNWGEKSNWNSGNEFNATTGGAEAQTDVSNDTSSYGSWKPESSDRGGYRGRGGFRGRGERGRFGGRGRSDRGGFGRGGSDRGGFGGRGRGRWNSEGGSNDGENKGWSAGGGNDNKGWSSGGGSDSKGWSSGGGGSDIKGWGNGGGGSDNKGWSSGGDGSDNKGWSSGGSGGDNKGWSTGGEGGGDSKGWGSSGGGSSDNKGWSSGSGVGGHDNKGWGSGGGGSSDNKGWSSGGSGVAGGDNKGWGSGGGGSDNKGWNSGGESGVDGGDNKGWGSGGGGNNKGWSSGGGSGGGGDGTGDKGWSSGGGGNNKGWGGGGESGDNKGWSSGGSREWEKSGSDGGGFGGRGRGRWSSGSGSNDGDSGSGGWSGGGGDREKFGSERGGGGFRGRGRGRWNQEGGSYDGDNGGRRGGYGGRGRGRWNQENGSNEGGDNGGRGGFGGRGRGRWNQDDGGSGGWSGGGGRGGFGGRGRGRRNQDGSNESNNDDKPASWSAGSGNSGGWSSSGGAGSWNQGGDEKNEQQHSWKSSNDGGQGSGWKEPSGNDHNNWKSSGSSGAGNSSGWNNSTAAKEMEESGGQNSWSQSTKTDSQGGGWQKSASSWNAGTENQTATKDVSSGSKDGGWGKSVEPSTLDKEKANVGAQGGAAGWEKPTSSWNTEQSRGENNSGGGGGAWGKSSSAGEGKSSSGWGS